MAGLENVAAIKEATGSRAMASVIVIEVVTMRCQFGFFPRLG